MRLLIVGATGGTGRELVKQALERGHEVTAFVRNPARLPMRHERLAIAQGNVLDFPTRRSRGARPGSGAVCARAQALVLSDSNPLRWNAPSDPRHGGARRASAGLRDRPRYQRQLGADGALLHALRRHSHPPFYFHDKIRQESLIRRSSLDWIIVRPGVLTNGRKRGVYRHGPNVGHWLWTVRISRADVADFMLDQLTEDTYLRQAVGLLLAPTGLTPRARRARPVRRRQDG